MNNQLIAIKKLNSVYVPESSTIGTQSQVLLSFNAELMRLGYCLSESAFYKFQNDVSTDTTIFIFSKVINSLEYIKGDDVNYIPMYPNFPKQVMDASMCELYLNALLHYFTAGNWKPEYERIEREFGYENDSFIELDLVIGDELNQVFTNIASSKDSISEEDKQILKYCFDNLDVNIPEEVPYKETMCFLACLALEKGIDIAPMIKTSTDLLRVITAMSDGDISLAENTKFKSLPRSIRRYLTCILENVINKEDIQRHANKWIRLFHNLHVGDFKYKKVNNISFALRNENKLKTFNSNVETLIKKKDYLKAVELLQTRPSEYARRLGDLLTKTDSNMLVAETFLGVADKVPTRVLTQLVGSMKSRLELVNKRVVFPKGNTQKAISVKTKLPALKHKVITKVLGGVNEILERRFQKLPTLGKTYVDPQLLKCPLPTQMRSASTAAFNVARGTRIPFGDDKNTLRFFIYWKGQDIDLSATLHNEKFEIIEQVSYTNLKSSNYEACHSGDITNAYNGASEFIDITIDKALKYGARYVAMNVLVYSGPTFAEHDICYAGWMTRSKPQSNEIYSPKTVKQKVDLTVGSKRAVPAVFDLKTREVIWLDIAGSANTYFYGNNVESNKASIEDVVESVATLNNKYTLGELFSLHAKARGTIVDSPDKADTVFGFDGTVTPYNINLINSEYLT